MKMLPYLVLLVVLVCVGAALVIFFVTENSSNTTATLQNTVVITNIKNTNLSTAVTNYQDFQQKYRNASICLSFSKHFQTDEDSQAVFTAFPELIEKLPANFEFGSLCTDPSFRSLFPVLARLPITTDDISRLQNETNTLFPQLSDRSSATLEDGTRYSLQLYAKEKLRVIHGGRTLQMEKDELLPVQEIVWSNALAGCSIEQGSFASTGTITLACGGGDNGCYRVERLQIRLADGATTKLGVCTKNCDLGPNDVHELSCK